MKTKDTKYLRKLLGVVEEHVARLQTISAKMQAAHDKRSDKWKESETGEKSSNEISDFDSMLNDFERVKTRLENLIPLDDDDEI